MHLKSRRSRLSSPFLNDRHPDIGTQGGIAGWLEKKAAACRESLVKDDQALQFTAEPNKGHAHAIDNFVDEIQGVGDMVCGIDDAVMATRVAFAAIKSAREGRIVKLSEV